MIVRCEIVCHRPVGQCRGKTLACRKPHRPLIALGIDVIQYKQSCPEVQAIWCKSGFDAVEACGDYKMT